MSGFLSNLAARARGTLPRLAPRRPGPFETLGDRSEPPDGDLAPPATIEPPARASGNESSTPAAAFTPGPEPVTGSTMPGAAPIGGVARSAALPATPATPAPAAPTRRMMSLAPAAALAPAAPASTQAAAPPEMAPSRASPAAETRAVVHPPLSPSVTKTVTAAVIPPDTIGDLTRNTLDGTARSDPEPVASGITTDDRPAVQLPDIQAPRAPAPLLARDDAAPRWAAQSREGNKASRSFEPQQSPSVEIHIGSIEVVKDPPQVTQPTPAARPNRGISLDDFLDGRGGR